jgi:sugar phosphate isomerase/epimerase
MYKTIVTVNQLFFIFRSMDLSVQLYTIREEMNKDFYGSLRRLGEIGYKNVETAFWPENISMETAADLLKETGLSVSACHTDIPDSKNISLVCKQAETFNCNKIIWHGWPEDQRYSTLAGTRELINIYNTACKLASDNGLHFGLHNHWWEFKNKVGGRYVYEILQEELDEAVFFETDIYWVKVAGQDPCTMIQQLRNRIQMLHIKDGAAEWNDQLVIGNPDPMTAVGKGTMDIPSILNVAKDTVQWIVVELDKSDTNVFDALQQSREYLSGFGMVYC